MFEKRVEKSIEWITENEDSFQNYIANQDDHDFHERTITDGLYKKVFFAGFFKLPIFSTNKQVQLIYVLYWIQDMSM